MQFVKINKSDKFTDLSNKVGSNNIDTILVTNSLTRSRNIGNAFDKLCKTITYIDPDTHEEAYPSISNEERVNIINKFTQDSDIFETVATGNSDSWKLLKYIGTLPQMLQVPSTITLPDSVDVLGNNIHTSADIYNRCINQIRQYGSADPSIFNEYSSIKDANMYVKSTSYSNPFQWFKIPWGDVTLYSSIADASVEFPVYPEELDNKVSATYTTMPDLMYTYEPWQVYQSSGPRTNTYSFHMHRDMWTGDHRDGMCNKLIRFCQANCYPEYKGSAVNTATVTLYMKGKPHISGIITDVNEHWEGPIGLDGWFLDVTLEITITEVSQTALNYDVVMNKSIIE